MIRPTLKKSVATPLLPNYQLGIMIPIHTNMYTYYTIGAWQVMVRIW